MDPATLSAIAVSILLNWAFSALTSDEPNQDALRRVCSKRHREEQVVSGNEIWEPVYCDEVLLSNGEYLK